MNLLRLTRHQMSQAQAKELARIYGNYLNVITVNETIFNADRFTGLINAHKADVLEVVLPLPLLEEVLRIVNIPVIRAVINRIVNTNGSITYEFDHYEQVHRVVVEMERL